MVYLLIFLSLECECNPPNTHIKIQKHTIGRFKVVVDKDMRKISNVVENLIR